MTLDTKPRSLVVQEAPSRETLPTPYRDFRGGVGLSSPPQLGAVIQGVDQLGCQLDVVTQNLLVLGDAVHVADPPGQVSVHAGAQFTLPQLGGGGRGERRE